LIARQSARENGSVPRKKTAEPTPATLTGCFHWPLRPPLPLLLPPPARAGVSGSGARAEKKQRGIDVLWFL
jgi:hypothetical protein